MYTREDVKFVAGLGGTVWWVPAVSQSKANVRVTVEGWTGVALSISFKEGLSEPTVGGVPISVLKKVIAQAEELHAQIESTRFSRESGWSKTGSEWVHKPTGVVVPERLVPVLETLVTWLELDPLRRFLECAKKSGYHVWPNLSDAGASYISKAEDDPALLRVSRDGEYTLDIQIEPRCPHKARKALDLYDRLVKDTGKPPIPWYKEHRLGGSYAVSNNSLGNFNGSAPEIAALKELYQKVCVPSTTEGVPSTTEGVSSTTEGVSSSTEGLL